MKYVSAKEAKKFLYINYKNYIINFNANLKNQI